MKIIMKKLILAGTTAAALVPAAFSGEIMNTLADLAADKQEIAIPAVPAAVKAKVPGMADIMETDTKGYVELVEPATPIEYVAIPGGKFTMGTTSIEGGFEDAKLVHEVTIKTFQMAKTAVTVAQYAECVIKGGCTEPDTSNYCNWGKTGRGSHPVNCVDWNQAQAYAKFKGARLPSEAEFEYAATSGGKNQKYPWGNEEPTSELAVFDNYGTMPVCSKPKGNTAQGLCDMSGNVWQWVQDKYQDSYKGAPSDGSAFKGAGSYRMVRGGSFYYVGASSGRADRRYSRDPGSRVRSIGFRLVR